MRLWSLHPKYLDSKGLVALWREALLAQKVLDGRTKGYTHHPQLERFKSEENAMKAIGCFLFHIYQEAKKRGYDFDKEKIIQFYECESRIQITSGQLNYEYEHLKKKLKNRDFKTFKRISTITEVEPHPIFNVTEGEIESWEKIY